MAEITLKPEASSLPLTVRPAWKQVLLVIGCSLFVAVCAHISVPLFFTPVPLSLAPFAVLLIGLGMSPGAAAACLTLYLIEGAAGLPVFSPTGPGGFLQLTGLTGGYLLAYPAAAALASWMYHLYRQSFTTAALSAGVASLVILASGASWLEMHLHLDFRHIVNLSITPFLAGDALKVCAAAAAVTGWSRMRRDRPHAEESL
jgi:biotin transport system substrate-specific component